MPKISFEKNRAPIEVTSGANLMQALLDAGIPVASSCHGKAVCCKCLVTLSEGRKNLSPETEDETHQKEVKNFKVSDRLSCQCQVLGDIKIDTTYW